jgi:hypothetical protein
MRKPMSKNDKRLLIGTIVLVGLAIAGVTYIEGDNPLGVIAFLLLIGFFSIARRLGHTPQ